MGTEEKRHECDITELPVVELQEFINVDFGNGYKMNLRKIGDSIIHSSNEGSMKYSNIQRYYEEIENFIVKAQVKKPYIEIRDLKNLTYHSTSQQVQMQIKYLRDHEADIGGFIVCNITGFLEIVIKSAFKLIKSPIRHSICRDYKEAIIKAIEFGNLPVPVGKEEIDAEDLIVESEWCLQHPRYVVENGIIPKKLFYTSLQGTFHADDMQALGESFQKTLEAGRFEGSEYIRIADYSRLPKVGLKVRSLYGKVIEELNKKNNCRAKVTFLCGANTFMRAAMQIYRVTTRQEIVFVDTVEQAFQLINSREALRKQNEGNIVVDQHHVDEIINLGGSLIWGGTQSIDQLVSPDNPLLKVAETLTVVQGDLAELREKDLEQNKILTESLKKMKSLTEELQNREEETQQLNEELRAANDQLLTQKEELESAQTQLLRMNNNLENLIKERTEKLKMTVDKLNKSVSELDRFVYSASHDLSAPLKSMLGLLHIARKDPDKSQTDKYFQYVEKSIYNLEEVIKSLISYSRNSRLAVKQEPLKMKELVDEVISELAFLPLAETIVFDVQITNELTVISDRQRLKVIFHNLINNSVKYAEYDRPDPFVKIGCTPQSEKFILTVTDNGIGIEPEQLEKIFEMFYRGTEKSKGSGLGLFIVKETVSVLNGDIEVNSVPGEGTTFAITIPLDDK